MKIKFNHFKQLFFESMLDEDKSHLIDRLVLPDIDDEEEKSKAREEMKAFFKKYNTWENKLDWNKLKTITYSDFEKIKDQASQTKGSQKREIASGDIKAIFKSIDDRKFEIVGENENWLFVAPLTYEAAVYCDSSENQGAGAKWCIGYEEDDSYWIDYIDGGSLFIMAFNKNYKSLNQEEFQTNLKYMIEKEKDGKINVWNQADKSSKFINGRFNISDSEINSMFDKVNSIYQKIQKEKEKEAKISVSKKIDNLKNITKIDVNYFTEDEKKLLTLINIPNNIKQIDKFAFYNCIGLMRVTIGNGVTSIGDWAFGYCSGLTAMKIPDSVTSIGEGAFAYCRGLTSVVIPDSVTSIGYAVFDRCSSLTSVTIPDSVTSIGSYAFYGCTGVMDVTIGNGVTSIGKQAFQSCKQLNDITFKGKTIKEVQSMDNYPWDIENPDKVIKVEK